MNAWIEQAMTFLAAHWLGIVIVMLVLYYLYQYLMLIVSVVIFPFVAIGSGLWSLQSLVHWPNDEDNRLSPRNFFFFLAGSLAFLIEIWLFSLFLEYYLLGESIMPLFGTTGLRMSVVSGIGFGMLTLIFGHLAHHLLSKGEKDEAGNRTENKSTTSEKVIGWASAIFFLVATLVLGYSGGLRAYTLATAVEAKASVVWFSIGIGAIFGFMMPFGAVIGMSRGGFLWHIVRNVLLGIPLILGMLLLIVGSFVFFLFEILLSLITLPISKLFSTIAGLAGFRLNESGDEEQLTGWKIGLSQLLSSTSPPDRLKNFLATTREKINFWDVES